MKLHVLRSRRHSTVQHSTVQYSTVQYSTAQYSRSVSDSLTVHLFLKQRHSSCNIISYHIISMPSDCYHYLHLLERERILLSLLLFLIQSIDRKCRESHTETQS